MSKIIDDPKVVAHVEKTVTKAVKEAQKAALTIVKDTLAAHVTAAKDAGDKTAAKALTTAHKETLAALKAA